MRIKKRVTFWREIFFPPNSLSARQNPAAKKDKAFFSRVMTQRIFPREIPPMRGGGGKRRTKSVSVQKLGRGPPLMLQFPHHHLLSPPPHTEKSYITFNFSAKVSRLMTQRRCSLRGKISRSTNKDRCFD